MDGTTTITFRKPRAISRARRLERLVRDLEADGYLIGPNRTGEYYWVKMAEIPTPEVCGLMRLNYALRADEKLRAALIPWLIKHRPYDEWERRIERQLKRPRRVISEDAEFPLPKAAPISPAQEA